MVVEWDPPDHIPVGMADEILKWRKRNSKNYDYPRPPEYPPHSSSTLQTVRRTITIYSCIADWPCLMPDPVNIRGPSVGVSQNKRLTSKL